MAKRTYDAIDENLPIHRQNLLHVQPLYWHTFYSLGARYPDLNQHSQSLIIETVAAVAEDDKHANPNCWGAKNHHLLLAPLLLSGHNEAWPLPKPKMNGRKGRLITPIQLMHYWRY